MVKDMRRVRVDSEADLRALLASVRKDGIPRLIEGEDGEALAVILNPDDYAEPEQESANRSGKERIMSFAGIWSDLNADEMIADIYRWRDDAPPSPAPSAHSSEDTHLPE